MSKSDHTAKATMQSSDLSVIIPVYNSEASLSRLVDRLAPVMKSNANKYELIFVNDGSQDNSWQVISDLCVKYGWIRGINLMRNYGQHNATLCGVRAARHEITITMDDDLQHPPEEIPKLLNKLYEGYDVVYGSPLKLPQGFFRNMITKYTKRLLAFVMGVSSVREISAFRALRTHLRNAFVNFQSPDVIIDVLFSWGTTRFISIKVNIGEPSERASNYNFLSLFKAAILILTGFSTSPLRFASFIGFVMTIIGATIFSYVLLIYFTVGSIPGFPFLASIIALFSGAQLFTLGIFGEYLARIFNRSMDRPSYIISEFIAKDQQ
jgi:glycosyltransferase involved in cell wall biosynthesis